MSDQVKQQGWMAIAPTGNTFGACHATKKQAIYGALSMGVKVFATCEDSDEWKELVAQGWRVNKVTITEEW